MNPVTVKNNLAADTTRNPSPAIWADARVLELIQNPGKGLYFHDDFQDFPLAGTQTTEIGHGKYKVFNTGAGKVSRVSAINSVEVQGGALRIALDTDNDQGAIAQAYPSYRMSGLKSTDGPLFFECCYAQNSILTNMAAVMIGLAEVEQWTLATAVPFNAGDAITNAASFIGFRIEEDGLGVVDTVYSDRATSFTNIGDTEAGTLAAYTFRKFGFVYDPTATPAECLTFYANNQKLTTKFTRSNLTGTTNLDSNALGLIFSACADSAGTAFEAYLKWWRVAQLFPDYG
jgi:hypothetical protein